MTIYGEWISGAGHALVTISRLERDGCEVHAPRDLPCGTAPALWIGAMGPFAIVAQPGPGRRRHLTARFEQPLEAAILAHFGA